MPGLDNNPFAVLTFIAAPAILTNASSVLALGTSNRFGRNVDRARELIKMLEGRDPKTDKEAAVYRGLLGQMERRIALLVRAMTSFYFSIGCFAAGSLTSLLGAIAASTEHSWLLSAALPIALATGIAGLTGLITGGTLLVRETRLALSTIRTETQFYRERYNLDSL